MTNQLNGKEYRKQFIQWMDENWQNEQIEADVYDGEDMYFAHRAGVHIFSKKQLEIMGYVKATTKGERLAREGRIRMDSRKAVIQEIKDFPFGNGSLAGLWKNSLIKQLTTEAD